MSQQETQATTNHLTPEQRAFIYKFGEMWSDRLLNNTLNQDLKISDIESQIEWLYSKVHMPKPMIFICNSYLEEKVLINYLIYYLYRTIGDDINDTEYTGLVNKAADAIEKAVKKSETVKKFKVDKYLDDFDKKPYEDKIDKLNRRIIISNHMRRYLGIPEMDEVPNKK